MSIERTKCLIIGSGPAGYTSSIYAARAGLNPILYQGLEPGGQLMLTTEVENYPGYPKGIMGPAMMTDLQQQASRFGTLIRSQSIEKVLFRDNLDYHVAIDEESRELRAQAIIIATGSSAKWLGLDSEKKLFGKGVSSCAVCDGFFFKNKNVAVVGGGDSAAQEALYLSNICSKIYLIIRKDHMKASKIMQQRVLDSPKIDILLNTQVKEVLGDEEVQGLMLSNSSTKYQLDIDALFVAIGHQPNTDIFKEQIDMDEQGYIITKSKSTETNIKGVFGAGDVQDSKYRQAITAAGTGCMAAIDAERYLLLKNH